MVHTVHLIDSGVLHRLENVPDGIAHDIMRWWTPTSDNPAVVPEYFQKVIKNEQGQMTRALLLRRGGISALDIVPVPGSEVPVQPVPEIPVMPQAVAPVLPSVPAPSAPAGLPDPPV